jgi:predicted nucleotidyltransferase
LLICKIIIDDLLCVYAYIVVNSYAMEDQPIHMRQNIPQQVKKAVLTMDPEAEVVLFGSQARGDSHEESDWDFLILTSREVSRSLKREIRDALWEIEMKEEVIISSLIVYSATWKDTAAWPIHQNIEREGITL